MTIASAFRLIVLSAIWGSSFLFMRIAVPALGPAMLICFRIGLAALFLATIAMYLRKPLALREHWRHYLILGLFNSALPFWLFAYAAKLAPASLMSILNATAPIWGAVIGGLIGQTRLSAKMLAGLSLGVIGVALLAGLESMSLPAGGGLAIAAALAAAFCYGVATTYAKSGRSAKNIEPFANAHGSMWGAMLFMLATLPFSPMPTALPNITVIGAVVALGVVCSGIAYLLYFRLIADIGATPALTVTFLIPVFGVLWGALFLGEQVGWHTLLGSLIVLSGTALVTGFSIKSLWPSKLLPSKPTST